MKQQVIKLKLRAKHFIGTDYVAESSSLCAIDKAAIDHFKTPFVSEGVYNLFVDSIEYEHKPYFSTTFERDNLKARKMPGNSIVRIIELKNPKIYYPL